MCIDQRSGSLQEPPADLRPQWMRSYCGFGAPEQLGEFMVSTRKRRALSSCQGWFPTLHLSLWRPNSLLCQGWTHTTAMHLRWGERALTSFWLPVAVFLLLSSLDRNMLAVYDAWQHKQSHSWKRGTDEDQLRQLPVIQVQPFYDSWCTRAAPILR